MSNITVTGDSAVDPSTAEDPTTDGSSIGAMFKHNVQIIHMAWGGAWFLGFGLNFLHSGPNHREFVRMPSWLPLTVLLGLLAAAGVLTAVLGVRVFGRGGLDPETVRRGKWYGMAWLLGFVGLILTIGTISGKLSSDNAGLVWGATATGLTAVLHLAGSAIWLDRAQFRLGIWITVVNIVGVMVGAGWQALVLSIGGGAVMLVLGAIGWSHTRRLV